MRFIGEMITRGARYYPDNLATVFKDIHFTYKELNDRVNQVGNALLKAGIRRGDRVGILCYNCHFYQEIFYGISKTGGVATTINWRLAPRELEFIINDAEVRILFVADRFWGQIEPIRDKLSTVKQYIMIGDPASDTIRYEKFLGSGSKEELRIDLDPHEPFWQLYTSGTTGRPKGVMVTHRNSLADTEHNIIGNRLNRDKQIWILVLPMFHIALKMMLIAAYVRAGMVFMDKFDPKEICETIEREKCTNLAIGPSMWQMFMNYPELDQYDISSLKYCSYSTAPMPPITIKRLMEKFPNIVFFSTYGLTEACSSLTILPNDQHVLDGPEHLHKRLASLGRPIDGVDIRIVDENGEDCPVGKIGEIIGRGDNIMKGYWRLPEETQKTLKEGWLYTGDMGYWDEYGYIYMADRKKDLIISGGENIYPKEVEDVIREVKGVVDVAVIGVPDEKWGEAVTAVVMKDPNSSVTGEDIIQYCAQNIAGYKKPKNVVLVSELPRNPVGKILKKVLREKYWQGRDTKV